MTTTATSTEHPTPAADAPVVHWPDPSPLQNWWTEVMDGVPQYRTSSGRVRLCGVGAASDPPA